MLHMASPTESPLLSETEGPAARVLNPHGRAQAILVCEHASRFIPAALNGLGLDDAAARSHAAYDIGAMDLAIDLMGALDAPLVAGRVSRLVYDCNRPPHSPSAMPERVEQIAVPGNRNLSGQDRARRVQDIYDPFRSLLGATLDAAPAPPLVITIHSFTPVWSGAPRAVELGLLHDADDAAARMLLALAQDRTDLRCALNEPYSAADGVTHTLREHAVPRGLPNVMIEVRNDLVDSPAGVVRVSGLLAPLLRDLIVRFADNGNDRKVAGLTS